MRDPVCGMEVSPDTPHRYSLGGEDVLFCSAGCKAKFVAAPEQYAKPKEGAGSCCSAHKSGEHGAGQILVGNLDIVGAADLGQQDRKSVV